MTLLEMTVVIMVLLSLITILFIGTRAWKRASNRSLCIMNITSVQKGVRAYSNLYGFDTGSTVPGLLDEVIGFDRFVKKVPICPGNGEYSFGEEFGVNTIPPIGTLYMTCSLADRLDHEPADYSSW